MKPQASYRQEVSRRITAAGCRVRKDSTRFVDTLITSSNDFFVDMSPREIRAYFEHAADFLFQRVGRQNVVSAVVHIDEKTPHMHITFVPLTPDNRLSAKAILGNRADMSRWQDDFHAHMVKAYPALERGERSRETGRRHIPMRVFKQAASLSKQAQQIEGLLQELNRINAPQKRDEAVALLGQWFPQMEDYAGHLKRYQGTIDHLNRQNRELAGRVEQERDANQQNRMEARVKLGRLESDVCQLRRFYDAVPEDIRQQVKLHMKDARSKGFER